MNTEFSAGLATSPSSGEMEQLFQRLQAELTNHVQFLPDKPEETAVSTLRALWHVAAGNAMSVQRAQKLPLPDLNAEESKFLELLVRKRIEGAPLAYLTGRQEFMGIELIAAPDALIPRAETELVGSAALSALKEILGNQDSARVIDVCTGSGNLALALASHEPRSRVWACDLSDEAIALSRKNLAALRLAERVEFRCGDLLAPFDLPEFHGNIDLIVCNPPYISSGKVDGMPSEISAHEPRLAFDGGPLGIRILFRMIADVPRYLRDGGIFAFEIGLGQGPGIRKKLEQVGDYTDICEVIDQKGQIRALSARYRTQR